MRRDNIPMPHRLPERDPDKKAEDQGLFRKFVVSRTDGKSDSILDKHFNCDYFVLDITHDPAALPAIKAYAEAIQETHPLLAKDLRKRYLGEK